MATENLISWRHDFDGALSDAVHAHRHVLLDFSAAPMWKGCARLDAEVYTDPRVAAFINDQTIPVRIHVRAQADDFKRLGARFNAQWTPTILLIDWKGEERHRIEGFLPVDDFLAQLSLGLAHSAFARGQFGEAERAFREVIERFPNTESAPEAVYWAGVSKYKATGDPAALAETAAQFAGRYQDTSWAKKASVWAKPAGV